MSRATVRERVRYWFDTAMSKGTVALIGWLGLISLGLILLVTLLSLWLTPAEAAEHDGFAGMLWATLMRTLSPGKVAGDTGSAPFIALMFAASLGGIFIVSALVEVLANGLMTKFERLRKGRSRVIETGHIVILGWSDQVFTIITELVQAHASERGRSSRSWPTGTSSPWTTISVSTWGRPAGPSWSAGPGGPPSRPTST